MAFTFVGYYDFWPGTPLPADIEHSRSTGAAPSPAFRQKVQEMPTKLPSTCKLIGSWAAGGRAAGVMVVEAESWDDLEAINVHYRGYLLIDWHPTRTGGVPRS
jgi:hypothetical protein